MNSIFRNLSLRVEIGETVSNLSVLPEALVFPDKASVSARHRELLKQRRPVVAEIFFCNVFNYISSELS